MDSIRFYSQIALAMLSVSSCLKIWNVLDLITKFIFDDMCFPSFLLFNEFFTQVRAARAKGLPAIIFRCSFFC